MRHPMGVRGVRGVRGLRNLTLEDAALWWRVAIKLAVPTVRLTVILDN